jgi:hypothetical protein
MMLRVRPISSLAVVVALLAAVGCDLAHDLRHERQLRDLVDRGASLGQVTDEFGAGYRLHEKGTPSWDDLQSFLQREPASNLLPLRENAAKYPKVLYYTTARRMTWIFFDEKDVMRAYYVTPQ